MAILDWFGGGDDSDTTTDDDYGGGRIGLDDDTGDGGGGGGGGDSILPDWIPTKKPTWWKALSTLAGASALGVSFTENPIGYIQALIYEIFINGVLTLFGWIGAKIRMMWDLFVGVLEGSGGAAYDSFAAVGAVPISVLSGLGDVLADLAGSSPLGLLVALLIWGAIAYLSIAAAARLWSALKTAIPLVIPWL